LDAFFFAPSSLEMHGLKARVKTGALELLKRAPTAYGFAHKCSYYVRRWRGKSRDILPPDQLIIRLLILKVWGDVFLNYPVVNTS
jgi:hypothetical protein